MNPKKTRIKYYDTLRFLAIISIIALHTIQVFHGQKHIGDNLYSFNEIVRFGVPVFLMITGALLLNREIKIGEFFKRRLNRLVYPFIFYLILHRILLYYIGTHHNPDLLWRVFSLPFRFNWYFWLIIGVYLLIPVINKFIQNADMKELEYFICVILFGSLFYQIMLFLDLKHCVDMSFFIGPVAYVVLGYYLSVKDFNMDANKIITIAIILFITTTIIKMGGNTVLPFDMVHNFQATKTEIIKSNLDLGTLQLLQAASVFVIFKYLYQSTTGAYSRIRGFLESDIPHRFILSVSRASYGMYLTNNSFKNIFIILTAGLTLTKIESVGLIILISVSISFMSWILVLLINRIPHFQKLSGYY